MIASLGGDVKPLAGLHLLAPNYVVNVIPVLWSGLFTVMGWVDIVSPITGIGLI